MAKSEIAEAIGEVVKSLTPQLEDIKKTSLTSSLILSVCLVDALSGFYRGQDSKKMKMKGRFEKFTEKYLYEYKDYLLEVRHGLVHSFSNEKNLMFIGSSEFLQAFPDLKVIFDSELFDVNKFKKDVNNAFNQYIEDVSEVENNDLRANFMKRYKSMGVIKDSSITTLSDSKGKTIAHAKDAGKIPGNDGMLYAFASKKEAKK